MLRRYRECYTNKEFVRSIIASAALFIGSVTVTFYAVIYATEHVSNPVTDLVLSNIPVFDVDGLFVYGTLFLSFFIIALCLHKPERSPFILKSLALFWLVRSVFITLTHLGPFPTMIQATDSLILTQDFIAKFTSGGDLFFSGHTGTPFLMALLFWQHKTLRTVFLAIAVFFGVIVLLGHLHYSIDVLSAFFITYSIYHIALFLFKRDWILFNEGLEKFNEHCFRKKK